MVVEVETEIGIFLQAQEFCDSSKSRIQFAQYVILHAILTSG